MDLVRFSIVGLASGAVYSLAGLGMVLVYKASAVVNLAAGGFGVVASYIFIILREDSHVPIGVAIVAGTLTGALLGAFTAVAIMRPMRRGSPASKMIATLGLLMVLQAGALLLWGDTTRVLLDPILPSVPVHLGHGVAVPSYQFELIGVAILLALGLKAFYSRSRIGLASLALAEKRDAIAGFGWSPGWLEVFNWTIGGAMCGITGILVSSIIGVSAIVMTPLALSALAAAVIGGFSSFGLTIAGAMVIGVTQSELARYTHVPGLATSVPLAAIVVVLLLRGHSRQHRGEQLLRLPDVGRGRTTPLAAGAAMALGIVLAVALPSGWVPSLDRTLGAAVLVLSVVVLTGYTGQLALSQIAVASIAVWVTGNLVKISGWPLWAAGLFGTACAVLAGVLVGITALRSRGVTLAVATLGAAYLLQYLVIGSPSLVHLFPVAKGFSHSGTGVDLFGLDFSSQSQPRQYALLALVALGVTMWLCSNLRRGSTGLRLLSVRSDEDVAGSLGVGVASAKLYAFGISGGIAAVGGLILAYSSEYPGSGDVGGGSLGSSDVLASSFIGGVGWIMGAPIGAFLRPDSLLGQAGYSAFGTTFDDWLPLVTGALLILVLTCWPDGAAAAIPRVTRLWSRSDVSTVTDRAPDSDPAPQIGRRRSGRRLEISGLTVRYGAVVAVDSVDLAVEPGEVRGVIGANGAGKSSLLDAVAGVTRPSAGTIRLGGEVINRWSPGRRARRGVRRSFQDVRLVDALSVRDNLLAGSLTPRWSYLTDLVHRRSARLDPDTRRIVERFSLVDRLDTMPAHLPFAKARLTDVARAVAGRPAVLLLDEPASGLDEVEAEELGDQIRWIARELGVTVVVVDHDASLMLAICDRITVLDFGRQIAEGTPADIRRSEVVRAAYLGADLATVSGP